MPSATVDHFIALGVMMGVQTLLSAACLVFFTSVADATEMDCAAGKFRLVNEFFSQDRIEFLGKEGIEWTPWCTVDDSSFFGSQDVSCTSVSTYEIRTRKMQIGDYPVTGWQWRKKGAEEWNNYMKNDLIFLDLPKLHTEFKQMKPDYAGWTVQIVTETRFNFDLLRVRWDTVSSSIADFGHEIVERRSTTGQCD